MTALLEVALALAAISASAYLLMTSTGFVTEEVDTALLAPAHRVHRAWLSVLVVALLAIDFPAAIPIMATILLAGYFIGPWLGGETSAAGQERHQRLDLFLPPLG